MTRQCGELIFQLQARRSNTPDTRSQATIAAVSLCSFVSLRPSIIILTSTHSPSAPLITSSCLACLPETPPNLVLSPSRLPSVIVPVALAVTPTLLRLRTCPSRLAARSFQLFVPQPALAHPDHTTPPPYLRSPSTLFIHNKAPPISSALSAQIPQL